MAALGGVLIGLAALAFFAIEGRTAGASGLLADMTHGTSERRWISGAFLAGLAATGVVVGRLAPGVFGASPLTSPLALVGAGLLVGVGTRLARGCTGGHGVCGIGFLSPRSFVATVTFMVTGALAVFATHALLGASGAP